MKSLFIRVEKVLKSNEGVLLIIDKVILTGLAGVAFFFFTRHLDKEKEERARLEAILNIGGSIKNILSDVSDLAYEIEQENISPKKAKEIHKECSSLLPRIWELRMAIELYKGKPLEKKQLSDWEDFRDNISQLQLWVADEMAFSDEVFDYPLLADKLREGIKRLLEIVIS